MFTKQEIDAAIRTRNSLIESEQHEFIDEKAIYIAGEICMWNDMQEKGVKTRDEIISLIKEFRNSIMPVGDDEINFTNKWIEDNLK